MRRIVYGWEANIVWHLLSTEMNSFYAEAFIGICLTDKLFLNDVSELKDVLEVSYTEAKQLPTLNKSHNHF
jgi:hypothetical protein